MIKRLIKIICTLITLLCITLFYLDYTGDIDLSNFMKPKYTEYNSEDYEVVNIPINDKYVRVAINTTNDLVSTNELNYWDYGDVKIIVTRAPVRSYKLTDKVFYNKNELSRKYDDNTIVVMDTKGNNKHTKEYFDKEELCTVVYNLTTSNETLDKVEELTDYTIIDNNIIPIECEGFNDEAATIMCGQEYFNLMQKFFNREQAIDFVSKRLGLYGGTVVIYQNDDYVFLTCGDRYAGIKMKSYNYSVITFAKGEKYKYFVLANTIGLVK